MLRITPNKSAQGAVKYFDEGLSKSDYYAEKGEIIGMWSGKGAALLGLSGEVDKDKFESLCYNVNPDTSEQLTARNDENRRVGYDFTFSVPKSVSIIYGQTKDKEILDAFQNAVHQTMSDIETEAQTRVRVNGKSEDRVTGNLVWGTFTHDDARPVNGIPDPHLHQHVFVFNATFDEVENKWKAAQFGDIKANGQYFETLFHARLADNLNGVGYQVERNSRDFEIKGFERSTIEKFSKRTLEINEKAEALGLTYSNDKAELGAKTRENKRTGYDKQDIRLQWRSRLSEKELELINSAKNTSGNDGGKGKNRLGFPFALEKKKEEGKEVTAKEALDHALSHTLERKSTVSEKELFIHGLKRSYGSVSPDALRKELKSRNDLLSKKDKNGNLIYTTREVIAEENKLRDAARKGKKAFAPLNPDYQIKNEHLNEEQALAVKHVLSSKDFITVVAGGAGTGKTWSMKEVAKGIAEKGIKFGAFAPSSAASRQVQRDDGFENATTISELLQSSKLQQSVKDGVIWIDEAGMVGNKTMNEIIKVAKEQNARLLLTGDIKQHGSVERGDALRIIEKFGGVRPATISKIQRQKVEDYRKAVKAISDGHIEQGLITLDNMGAIKEADDLNQVKKNVAAEYVSAVKAKEDVLIVATTHAQGSAVTGSIREGLKAEGILQGKENTFRVQKSLSFTDAQKADKTNYEPGMTIQFHQNVSGGFQRASIYEVTGKDKDGNVLITENSTAAVETKKEALVLPLKSATRFSVYQSEEIAVAKGDKIRVTQNGFSDEKKRLDNGNILTVKGFDRDGNILANTGKNSITINKGFGNFTHGYYTTSPGSQGKSVNRIIIMQSSATGKSASKEQFYVSASRGKFAISIHTDDKNGLFSAVQRSSSRMTASELIPQKSMTLDMQDRLKKLGSLYRTGLSKLSKVFENGTRYANILSMYSRPIQPTNNVPTRTK